MTYVFIWALSDCVQVPSGSLVDLFQNMEWGADSILWEQEADLRKAISYVRGSKLLRIPEEWRNVIPKSIWKLFSKLFLNWLISQIKPKPSLCRTSALAIRHLLRVIPTHCRAWSSRSNLSPGHSNRSSLNIEIIETVHDPEFMVSWCEFLKYHQIESQIKNINIENSWCSLWSGKLTNFMIPWTSI